MNTLLYVHLQTAKEERDEASGGHKIPKERANTAETGDTETDDGLPLPKES